MSSHVAPARQVFTAAHVVDPERPGSPDDDRSRAQPGATVGHTVCGVPMLVSDVWIAYDPTPGDRVCPRCLGAAAPIEDDLFGGAA